MKEQNVNFAGLQNDEHFHFAVQDSNTEVANNKAEVTDGNTEVPVRNKKPHPSRMRFSFSTLPTTGSS